MRIVINSLVAFNRGTRLVDEFTNFFKEVKADSSDKHDFWSNHVGGLKTESALSCDVNVTRVTIEMINGATAGWVQGSTDSVLRMLALSVGANCRRTASPVIEEGNSSAIKNSCMEVIVIGLSTIFGVVNFKIKYFITNEREAEPLRLFREVNTDNLVR